jgi:Rrf2 family protein
MKLSTRSRYGTRLMLDMAEHYNRGAVQLGTLARRQGVSLKYLEQIIIPLKRANYVVSSRGFKGGHRLAKPPEEISVGEIVALLEGGDTLTDCAANPEACDRSVDCVTRWVWREAAEAMYRHLNGMTLADLLKRKQANGGREIPGECEGGPVPEKEQEE